jgi:hypothetical protein
LREKLAFIGGGPWVPTIKNKVYFYEVLREKFIGLRGEASSALPRVDQKKGGGANDGFL